MHQPVGVSIHARVRAGDDGIRQRAALVDVSIHARVRAGDVPGKMSGALSSEFQSTPACERATTDTQLGLMFWQVSIHARVRAGDIGRRLLHSSRKRFQSTPACERATSCQPKDV